MSDVDLSSSNTSGVFSRAEQAAIVRSYFGLGGRKPAGRTTIPFLVAILESVPFPVARLGLSALKQAINDDPESFVEYLRASFFLEPDGRSKARTVGETLGLSIDDWPARSPLLEARIIPSPPACDLILRDFIRCFPEREGGTEVRSVAEFRLWAGKNRDYVRYVISRLYLDEANAELGGMHRCLDSFRVNRLPGWLDRVATLILTLKFFSLEQYFSQLEWRRIEQAQSADLRDSPELLDDFRYALDLPTARGLQTVLAEEYESHPDELDDFSYDLKLDVPEWFETL